MSKQDKARSQGSIAPPFTRKESTEAFLAKTVSGTFGFKILNVLLVYANSLLIVRLVGASGYGEYVYTISWVQILLLPAALGFEGLLNRELAVYIAGSQWNAAKGLIKSSNLLIFFNSIFVAAIAFLILSQTGVIQHLEHPSTFWLGLFLLPVLALSRLRQYALRALHKVLLGEVPESLVRPIGLVIILAATLFLEIPHVNASSIMAIEIFATGLAFATGTVFLIKSIPKDIQQAKPETSLSTWVRQALPMLLIGGMYVINQQTDSVMLGILQDSQQVGIYAVVNRGSGLLGFVQLAFAAPLSAIFATLHAQGSRLELQNVVRRSCQASLICSLLLAVTLVLFSNWFLQLFGTEFLVGKTALIILVIAQLFNSLTGAVAMLLIMTGFDGKAALGVGISAGLNIILNAWLIPLYGIEGAAIATGISLVMWNILLVYFAQQCLGVRSLPI